MRIRVSSGVMLLVMVFGSGKEEKVSWKCWINVNMSWFEDVALFAASALLIHNGRSRRMLGLGGSSRGSCRTTCPWSYVNGNVMSSWKGLPAMAPSSTWRVSTAYTFSEELGECQLGLSVCIVRNASRLSRDISSKETEPSSGNMATSRSICASCCSMRSSGRS